jgi:hypothetical protein
MVTLRTHPRLLYIHVSGDRNFYWRIHKINQSQTINLTLTFGYGLGLVYFVNKPIEISITAGVQQSRICA